MLCCAAGMLEALPGEVQAMLRRRGPARGLSTMPIDLAIEARDPRTASDIVLQVLAFRCDPAPARAEGV